MLPQLMREIVQPGFDNVVVFMTRLLQIQLTGLVVTEQQRGCAGKAVAARRIQEAPTKALYEVCRQGSNEHKGFSHSLEPSA